MPCTQFKKIRQNRSELSEICVKQVLGPYLKNWRHKTLIFEKYSVNIFIYIIFCKDEGCVLWILQIRTQSLFYSYLTQFWSVLSNFFLMWSELHAGHLNLSKPVKNLRTQQVYLCHSLHTIAGLTLFQRGQGQVPHRLALRVRPGLDLDWPWKS